MPHPLEGVFLTADLPEERLVVICRFREGFQVPQNPAILLQVTVDRSKVSPSGHLIRFGQTFGDEIVGWQHRELLEVIEVLGRLEEDNQTVRKWVDDPEELARMEQQILETNCLMKSA